MTSPRTLILSIAATACGFILALVAVIGQASSAATPVSSTTMVPAIVSTVAEETSHGDAVAYVVALEPTGSHSPARTR